MRFVLKWSYLLVVSIWAAPLYAAPIAPAQRVMSFSGVSNFGVRNAAVAAETGRAVCMVQVSNVDSELQILMDVQFGPGALSPDESVFQGLKSSSSECKLPVKLARGESCLFIKKRPPVSATSRIFSCNGTLTVSNAGTPGSVIAAGAIVTLAEMELIGGVLSGAHYASGSHVSFNSVQERGSEITPFAGTSLHTHNMNLTCVSSCLTYAGAEAKAFCELQCGELAGDSLFLAKTQNMGIGGVLSAGLVGQVPEGTYDVPGDTRFVDTSATRFPQKNINIRMPIYEGGCTTEERTQDGQKTNCTVLVPNAPLSYSDLTKVVANIPMHPFSTWNPQNSCSLFSGDGGNRKDIRPTLMRDILGLDNVIRSPEPTVLGRLDSQTEVFGTEARGKFLPERVRSRDVDEDYLRTVGGSGDKGEPRPADPTRAVGRVSPSLEKGYPTTSLARGNSHFGGGLVYEIVAGGASAICTGDLSSYRAGASVPILHSHLALDVDQAQLGLAAVMGATDLLHCSHRHRKSDWLLSVGKSSPFLINAGMEF